MRPFAAILIGMLGLQECIPRSGYLRHSNGRHDNLAGGFGFGLGKDDWHPDRCGSELCSLEIREGESQLEMASARAPHQNSCRKRSPRWLSESFVTWLVRERTAIINTFVPSRGAEKIRTILTEVRRSGIILSLEKRAVHSRSSSQTDETYRHSSN
jgi:hypothetical protein